MIIEILYLIAAVLFILGVKQLTKVRTAKRGNLCTALGMFIAILATMWMMVQKGTIGWTLIASGLLIGAIIGVLLARMIAMTAMPQLVALFNGLGGAASVLVALAYTFTNKISSLSLSLTVMLSIMIGAVTFTGSIIAMSKLQGWIPSRPLVYPGYIFVTGLLFIAAVSLAMFIMFVGVHTPFLFIEIGILVGMVLLLGLLLVLPIGGADMPVVVALLNSYSGLAAAAAGFVLSNMVLIISGSLVGASGLILTQMMCKAMNRSLASVMLGGFGAEVSSSKKEEYKNVKEASVEEAAIILDNAQSVVVVPGYGLAVAQAHYLVQELAELLEEKKIDVKYAIHPVAGRMPGHMNVLLAEANVPYDKLFDLDQINGEFKQTDVVIVVGANDTVNPAASKDKSSPLYGMPVLKVEEAQTVLVIKRSLSPGFSGVKNNLFELDNTRMVYGDAKAVLGQVVVEMKEL